jgi:hypothetical protein
MDTLGIRAYKTSMRIFYFYREKCADVVHSPSARCASAAKVVRKYLDILVCSKNIISFEDIFSMQNSCYTDYLS